MTLVAIALFQDTTAKCWKNVQAECAAPEAAERAEKAQTGLAWRGKATPERAGGQDSHRRDTSDGRRRTQLARSAWTWKAVIAMQRP